MPLRESNAQWNGGLKKGNGFISSQSGALESFYSFGSRFQEGHEGTNPEELIGAALAGCFSMFFSMLLEQRGHEPRTIQTRSKVHLDQTEKGFQISSIELHSEADVPQIEERALKNIAEEAKRGCPVSQAIKVPVSLSISLKTTS
ncbi:MAG: OsmC family peroxiredoxin [Chitinispirillaceae bacterium]